MGVVRKIKRQSWYLGKYLSKGDFERYYYSSNWVFPGWIGFSNWVKKEFSHYPKREVMVQLGKMSSAQRADYTWFWLYLWEEGKRKEGRGLERLSCDIISLKN